MAYARFGCESVVLEGIASGRDFADLPIAVHAVTKGQAGLRRAGRGLLHRRGGVPAGMLTFGAFLAYYLFVYGLKPLRRMRRASLYHLHSYEYFPLALLWSALFGGSIVYDAHDFYSGIQNAEELCPSQRRWIRRFMLWLERTCVRRADAFLTVSDGTAALMERQFGRRPQVLRNCHDFRLDRRAAHTLRNTAGLAADEFLVVSTGQWKSGQATAEAIAALKLLPAHVHLAFVGDGYEWVLPQAEEQGLANRVHPIGAVPADEVVPFIASADAALVHYRRHSANYVHALPNGFFQALAAGLPLVYAELPEIDAAARAFGAGIRAEDCTPPALAAALRRLVEDPAERERQRDAARVFSMGTNFEKEEKILDDILRQLVAATSGDRSCAA